MYEQASHAMLNEILMELNPEIGKLRLRHFYTRLGANFYNINTLFHHLYGDRADFKAQMVSLVETLAHRYIERTPTLRKSDLARERDYNWFLSQKWVGMALYCDRFAGDLKGLRKKLPYLQELGVNMLHVMPILDCPEGASDGGYAVRDFEDGSQAWEFLEANPDGAGLVVTDLEMPRMDGFELTRRIKADDRLKHLTVIGLSALASETDLEKGKKAGIDQYQIKLDKELLLQAVSDHVR